ncbi:inositol 2-dehydrogenase [Anaeromicrobium sediminis]|uniref:Inositol 2-dehydrogenase n=1 Tax=Anaeromicrobium sediminis TaxID=1478221 RepID=A0A267MCQ5_9FIRM|nr:inositol 2-dehydrogenase [Anaeromicrobium sediminis]PAB56645.1 inositol 2-dehydrogenase [Anaeromicrobium sediminis]
MIRVGIIGVGRIGRLHTENICYNVPMAKVVSIADPFMSEDTEKWANNLGITKCYKDYNNILNDKEVDAVFICSSTNTHAPISIEAIEAHKHVFCEKPVDLSIEKIVEVMEVLKHKDIKYQVGFNRRFDHNFKAVRDAVANNKIGDPHIMRITSRDPAPPPIEYVKVSGGLFLDMTIHDFDMARYLVDSDVKEIFVQADVLVDDAIGEVGDVDTAIVSMKMENGTLAIIENSRKAVYGYDQRVEILGSQGMVGTKNDLPSTAVISNENGVTGEKPLHFFLERYMDSFKKEVIAFVDAINNDTPVPVDINDGLKSVIIGMAAKKSLEEGRPVKISEIKL